MNHQQWETDVCAMTADAKVTREMLARVFSRVMLADRAPSRADVAKGDMLARPERLAPATVTKAVDALIKLGLLTESAAPPDAPRRIGRPGSPLQIGSPRWAVIGIHVQLQPTADQPTGLTGVLCNLARQPLRYPEPVRLPPMGAPGWSESLIDGVVELVNSCQQAQGGGPDGPAVHLDLLGVGIEIGCHVHHGQLVHTGASARDVIKTPIVNALSDKLGVPVILENDVDALAIHALASRQFKATDAALVSVADSGVGGALVIDGRIYRGSHGMAMEPGHLTVEFAEPHPAAATRPAATAAPEGSAGFSDPCWCSPDGAARYGHVDAIATPARICGEVARVTGSSRDIREISDSPAFTGVALTPEAMAMQRAGRALGRGIAQVINVANPGELLVRLPSYLATPKPQASGEQYRLAMEAAVNEAFSSGSMDARAKRHQLRVHSVDPVEAARDGALSAATAVVNSFIKHTRGRDGCPAVAAKSPTRDQPSPRPKSRADHQVLRTVRAKRDRT